MRLNLSGRCFLSLLSLVGLRLTLVAAEVTPGGADAASHGEPRRVLVEYFFSPGCPECGEISRTVLPVFTNVFDGLIDFRAWDIDLPANYVRLANLQERLGVRSNEPVSIYVDRTIPLLGVAAIREDLERVVVERLGGGEGGMEPPDEAETWEEDREEAPPGILTDRLGAFTVPAVMLAGLVDGINPCAFAAIVFFISLLGVAGVKDARLLMVGAAYTLAVFGTYLLLGLGAFRLLRTLQAWQSMGNLLRWAMIVALAALAAVSFKDAWAFKRHGRAADVKLQLPDRLKRRMHEIMRTRLRPAHLFLSTLGIGVLVTLIEAACTGQIYLPTLVVLSRYAETRGRAFPLLLLYNVMFVVPLIVVIAAAFLGARNPRLLAWSRSNVVWGKAAMGLLFAGLALILWVF